MDNRNYELLEKFTYVGEFVVSTTSGNNLIGFNKVLSVKEMSNKQGRIYSFVEVINGEMVNILKIGKSSDKSGLNGTIGCYSSALSGTPGQNRFCMHHMIYDKLNNGSQIKVYVRFVESVKKIINGLFSEIEMEIPLDVTYVEQLCLSDYKIVFGDFPEWNFQERGETLPIDLMENFGIFISNKKKNKKEI
jgi:hypothetical protein